MASKITEGLAGESLKVAISLGLTELAKKEGVQYCSQPRHSESTSSHWGVQRPENSSRLDRDLVSCPRFFGRGS